MDAIAYTERLRGRTALVSAGVLRRSETNAHGRLRLEVEALLSSGGSFREQGTITFPDGDELRLRTLGTGLVGQSCEDATLRLGTVTWEIDGGTGRWRDAAGRISSSFTVTADGTVDDEQRGLIVPAPDIQFDRRLTCTVLR